MNMLNVAFYTIKRNLRDRRSMINMILMPIVLILILGTALDSFYSPKKIEKVSVLYLNEDMGAAGKQFDGFLGYKEIRELLDIKKVASEKDGRKLLDDGKASMLIYIDKAYSENVINGKKAEIKVLTANSEAIDESVVKSIIDGFNNRANTVYALGKMGKQVLKPEEFTGIKDQKMKSHGKIPGAMDYYAVTMMVLIIMNGGMLGIHGIGDDFMNVMGNRLKSLPVRIYSTFIGKTLGIVFTVFIQTLIIILFTKYVYKANWGGNILPVLLISLLFSVIAVSLGVMLCLLMKDRKSAALLLQVAVPATTFLSGGYSKINVGSAIEKLRYLFPNYLAQTSMFNFIYDGPVWQTQLCIGIMLLMLAVILVISTLAARRRLI